MKQKKRSQTLNLSSFHVRNALEGYARALTMIDDDETVVEAVPVADGSVTIITIKAVK